MIVGVKVTGLSRNGSYVFVKMQNATIPDITIMFDHRDPRIKEFEFDAEMTLEVNNVITSPVRLIK